MLLTHEELEHEELETIATFSLEFGFSDLFQTACRLILGRKGFSMSEYQS
jgi:hypothetical protein